MEDDLWDSDKINTLIERLSKTDVFLDQSDSVELENEVITSKKSENVVDVRSKTQATELPVKTALVPKTSTTAFAVKAANKKIKGKVRAKDRGGDRGDGRVAKGDDIGKGRGVVKGGGKGVGRDPPMLVHGSSTTTGTPSNAIGASHCTDQWKIVLPSLISILMLIIVLLQPSVRRRLLGNTDFSGLILF